MLKRKFKRLIIIIQLMITTVFFLGCNNKSVEEVSKINLNKGAFVFLTSSYLYFIDFTFNLASLLYGLISIPTTISARATSNTFLYSLC